MKESEAWVILAESRDKDEGSQFLCITLKFPRDYPSAAGYIPNDIRARMVSRVMDVINPDQSWGSSAYDPEEVGYEEGKEARVLACLLFAEIARDEGN